MRIFWLLKGKTYFIYTHYESRDTVPVQGEEGLLAGLSAGKVWIDHSTTDYEQARRYDYFSYCSLILNNVCFSVIVDL